MPSSDQTGFRIIRPLELLNWQPLFFTDQIPLAHRADCPACRTALEPLANLQGASGPAIRVGVCSQCGTVAYQDCPAADWLARYYAEIWTSDAQKDPAAVLRKRQKPNAAWRAVEKGLTLLSHSLRPVADIGAGYGTLARALRDAGCQNVLGIESSRRRAQTAAATGIPMLIGNFEAPEVQAELDRRAPIALFTSFHVLEHTHDPGAFIAAAAKLQAPGDLFVLGVPDVLAEPAMTMLLFLPHLQSFSAEGLRMLFAAHGYRVENAMREEGALNVIARRTAEPAPAVAGMPDAKRKIVKKFLRELLLDSDTPMKGRYAWHKDDARQSALLPWRPWWRLADRFAGRRMHRSLLVAPRERRTGDAPVTIEFPESVFLCYK